MVVDLAVDGQHVGALGNRLFEAGFFFTQQGHLLLPSLQFLPVERLLLALLEQARFLGLTPLLVLLMLGHAQGLGVSAGLYPQLMPMLFLLRPPGAQGLDG